MSRIDDLLTLENAGELPPSMQKDLDTLRQAGEVPARAPQPRPKDKTPGLVTPGTITNLYNRPVLVNPDKSVSTTRSMSFNEDGKEILIPTVVEGKSLTPDQAIERYHKTGEHLGIFDSPQNADAYAEALHQEQARRMQPQFQPQLQPQTQGESWPAWTAKTGIRIGLPLAAGLATAGLGPVSLAATGAASAGAEALVRYLFNEDMNPRQIALSGVLGAIPGFRGASIVSRAGRIALRGAEGLLFGAGGSAASRLVEGESPDLMDMLKSGGFGGLLGAGFGRFERLGTPEARPGAGNQRLNQIAQELQGLDQIQGGSQKGLNLLKAALSETRDQQFQRMSRGEGSPAVGYSTPDIPLSRMISPTGDLMLPGQAGTMQGPRLGLPAPGGVSPGTMAPTPGMGGPGAPGVDQAGIAAQAAAEQATQRAIRQKQVRESAPANALMDDLKGVISKVDGYLKTYPRMTPEGARTTLTPREKDLYDRYIKPSQPEQPRTWERPTGAQKTGAGFTLQDFQQELADNYPKQGESVVDAQKRLGSMMAGYKTGTPQWLAIQERQKQLSSDPIRARAEVKARIEGAREMAQDPGPAGDAARDFLKGHGITVETPQGPAPTQAAPQPTPKAAPEPEPTISMTKKAAPEPLQPGVTTPPPPGEETPEQPRVPTPEMAATPEQQARMAQLEAENAANRKVLAEREARRTAAAAKKAAPPEAPAEEPTIAEQLQTPEQRTRQQAIRDRIAELEAKNKAMRGELAPEAEEAAPTTPTLPRELAGAKPTYNYGKQKVNLAFDSDLDKAAYIVASKQTLSAQDQKYLDFVIEQTGRDEAGARRYGEAVKTYIKQRAAMGQQDVEVPSGFITPEGVVTTRPGVAATVAQDPRDVGGTYRSGYWGLSYQVLAKKGDDLTVRWADGRETTQSTKNWKWYPKIDTVVKDAPTAEPAGKLDEAPPMGAPTQIVGGNKPPMGVSPAVKLNDDTVVVGAPGQTHDQITSIPTGRTIRDKGWVNDKGEFLTDDEATAEVFRQRSAQKTTAQLLKGSLGERGAVGATSWADQNANEKAARADRQEVFARIKRAIGLGKTEDEAVNEAGVTPQHYQQMQTEAKFDDAVTSLGGAAQGLKDLNERARQLLGPEAESIAQTGTMTPGGPGWRSESRETFRENAGAKPNTYTYRVSERDVDYARNMVINAERKVVDAADAISHYSATFGAGSTDPLTVEIAKSLKAQSEANIRDANKWADIFRKQRFALGRGVRAYDRAPFPLDVIESMQRRQADLTGIMRLKRQIPIDSQILESVGKIIGGAREGEGIKGAWNTLTPSEQVTFRRNLINSPRLGLFSTTSAVFDVVSDISETAAQVASGLAGDIVHNIRMAGQDKPASWPALTGMYRALKRTYRDITNPAMASLSEEFQQTFSGERLPGQLPMGELMRNPLKSDFWTQGPFVTSRLNPAGELTGQGVFTRRQTQASAGWDTIRGMTGVYAKGAVDTGFKRFAATMTMWRDIETEADRQGIPLHSAQRKQFEEDTWKNLPQAVLDNGVREGNKAGFNRPLYDWEERVARSKGVQLMFDAFGRWGFQFAHWGGEMIGANPQLQAKWAKALWSRDMRYAPPAEETARYLTRMATGIGGLYLMQRMLYNNIDFKSMEYVKEDGNRVRLSSIEPLSSGLTFLALLHGDQEKFLSGLQYSSLPGLRWIFGQGGMLSQLTDTMKTSFQTKGKLNTREMGQAVTDTLNKMIPGQAVLGGLKTILDPTVREGFGANLPGISLALQPKINLATGDPMQPRQRFAFMELPSISGTPIPMATRLLEPTAKLLSRYGMLTYRGPRAPIAGFPAGEVPDDKLQEFSIELGRARDQIFHQVMPYIEAQEARQPDQARQPGQPFYEQTRKLLERYDAMAADHARKIINQRYGTPSKMGRQPTVMERLRPGYGQFAQ
jgi:hypothetical protein